MKTTCKIIIPALLLFYLAACTKKEDSPPCLLTADINVIEVNDSTKKLAAVASGGLAPYTYRWYPVAGLGVDDDTLLVLRSAPKEYNVEVKDQAGCYAWDTVFVGFSNSCPFYLEIIVDSINVNDKRLSAIARFGARPYSYAWSTGATDSAFIIANPSGAYSITVTDSAGCSVTKSVTITGSGSTPVGMQINSVKVRYFRPEYSSSLQWDNESDNSYADLRLSINRYTGLAPTPTGFYTTQIFVNQAAAPVTFLSAADFPFTIPDSLSNWWQITLWDDDAPASPEEMGGVSFSPALNTSYTDSFELQSGVTGYPTYTIYFDWLY